MNYETIDSRDLEKEIAELEPMIEEWNEIVNNREEEARRDEYPGLENISRYEELCQLRDECHGSGWEHGIVFVPELAFADYARELAEDIGAIDRDANWPLDCIDWELAARELAHDYMMLTFDGVDYYYREA